jgi:Ni,Fe-hydrogenase III large subunit
VGQGRARSDTTDTHIVGYTCGWVLGRAAAAQEQVRTLRASMLDTHRQLQLLVTKRDALARLWFRSLEHRESLKLLSKMYATRADTRQRGGGWVQH